MMIVRSMGVGGVLMYWAILVTIASNSDDVGMNEVGSGSLFSWSGSFKVCSLIYILIFVPVRSPLTYLPHLTIKF